MLDNKLINANVEEWIGLNKKVLSHTFIIFAIIKIINYLK
jgi:hypothetical protein